MYKFREQVFCLFHAFVFQFVPFIIRFFFVSCFWKSTIFVLLCNTSFRNECVTFICRFDKRCWPFSEQTWINLYDLSWFERCIMIIISNDALFFSEFPSILYDLAIWNANKTVESKCFNSKISEENLQIFPKRKFIRNLFTNGSFNPNRLIDGSFDKFWFLKTLNEIKHNKISKQQYGVMEVSTMGAHIEWARNVIASLKNENENDAKWLCNSSNEKK